MFIPNEVLIQYYRNAYMRMALLATQLISPIGAGVAAAKKRRLVY